VTTPIDALRDATLRLEHALLVMRQMRVLFTDHVEGRALAVAITEAETALLWLKSVRPEATEKPLATDGRRPRLS